MKYLALAITLIASSLKAADWYLIWDARPASEEILYYRVWMRPAASLISVPVARDITGTSWMIPNTLVSNAVYYLQVSAVNAITEGPRSVELAFTNSIPQTTVTNKLPGQVQGINKQYR